MTPEARKKRFAKAACLLLLAVLAGVVIGVGGTILYFQSSTKSKRGTSAIADAMMRRLGGLVTLTPEESARVRAVVDSRLEKIAELRKRRFKEIRQVFLDMDAPMEEIIGKNRMDVWKAYRSERFERRNREMQTKDTE